MKISNFCSIILNTGEGLMTTFYNSAGQALAYTEDDEHIFLFSGEPVAVIYEDSIYSFTGKHLGWLDNGWIYDQKGQAAFMTEHSKSGPSRPTKQLSPLKSLRRLMPLKGLRALKPLKPLKSLSWSVLSSKDFFEN
ncbi:MAG: hypothetical protein EYC62_00415 [Alphaproteobacteria bacterium]|nr:MAG: hypothetical protein EYC62_00415 [Alphaproteobacteria bacterium]